MNLREKIEFYRQNKHELFRAIMLCVFILLVIVIGYYVATGFKNSIDKTLQQASAVISPRYWFINKVTPDEANSTFSLDISSNVGNVRNYSGILSYGLSQNGKFLAVHNNEGVYVINLDDESKKNVKTAADKFSGDIGEVIDWSFDDSYFLLPAILPNPKHTEVWIYTKEGTLFTSITADIPVSEIGKSIVEPVYFSNKSNILLMRIYKQDDLKFIQEGTTPYSVYGLPIYLVTYNLQGKKIEEFNVRDYDTTGTNVIYLWDKDSNYIDYYIYKDVPPDVNKDYLFTKQAAFNE